MVHIYAHHVLLDPYKHNLVRLHVIYVLAANSLLALGVHYAHYVKLENTPMAQIAQHAHHAHQDHMLDHLDPLDALHVHPVNSMISQHNPYANSVHQAHSPM
jgi:hypothetical protein